MSDSLKDCPIWNAQYHMRFAYEYLLRAHVLNRADLFHKSALDQGIQSISAALDALGYDLVKRETAKSEAA